jgi:hypothetical protein
MKTAQIMAGIPKKYPEQRKALDGKCFVSHNFLQHDEEVLPSHCSKIHHIEGITMKNAHQRFGKLAYVRRTEKASTNIRGSPGCFYWRRARQGSFCFGYWRRRGNWGGCSSVWQR